MTAPVRSLVVEDVWDRLPKKSRATFLQCRAAEGRWPHGAPEGWQRGRRWQPMRPLAIDAAAYRGLGEATARLLRLAVDACRRRAATAGELREVMGDTRVLRLLEPDRPLVHDELLRIARPDVLLCGGVPQFVEFNIAIPLYGIPALDRMAAAYARLWQHGPALTAPEPVLQARAALLAEAARWPGTGVPRLLVPTWGSTHGLAAKLGSRRALRLYLRPTVESARQHGLEVVVADLSRLRTGADGRLLAEGRPVDLVLNWFITARITGDAGGLDAIARALNAGTVRLFHPEAMRLLSAKQVLAWLHEDLPLLAPADRELVTRHVPWTAWTGPGQPAVQRAAVLRRTVRDRGELVLKPSTGSSGQSVVFGAEMAPAAWCGLVADRIAAHTVVLQRRVEPDRVTMPFLAPADGTRATARLPFVLAPFLVGGRITGALVRHLAPGDSSGAGAINTGTGAVVNTVLLHGG